VLEEEGEGERWMREVEEERKRGEGVERVNGRKEERTNEWRERERVGVRRERERRMKGKMRGERKRGLCLAFLDFFVFCLFFSFVFSLME